MKVNTQPASMVNEISLAIDKAGRNSEVVTSIELNYREINQLSGELQRTGQDILDKGYNGIEICYCPFSDGRQEYKFPDWATNKVR